MVDASVQSDTDDFSDGEMLSFPRRVYALQTVPEEKHHDTQLVILSIIKFYLPVNNMIIQQDNSSTTSDQKFFMS